MPVSISCVMTFVGLRLSSKTSEKSDNKLSIICLSAKLNEGLIAAQICCLKSSAEMALQFRLSVCGALLHDQTDLPGLSQLGSSIQKKPYCRGQEWGHLLNVSFSILLAGLS